MTPANTSDVLGRPAVVTIKNESEGVLRHFHGIATCLRFAATFRTFVPTTRTLERSLGQTGFAKHPRAARRTTSDPATLAGSQSPSQT
jgi:hypothetical protein